MPRYSFSRMKTPPGIRDVGPLLTRCNQSVRVSMKHIVLKMHVKLECLQTCPFHSWSFTRKRIKMLTVGVFAKNISTWPPYLGDWHICESSKLNPMVKSLRPAFTQTMAWWASSKQPGNLALGLNKCLDFYLWILCSSSLKLESWKSVDFFVFNDELKLPAHVELIFS